MSVIINAGNKDYSKLHKLPKDEGRCCGHFSEYDLKGVFDREKGIAAVNAVCGIIVTSTQVSLSNKLFARNDASLVCEKCFPQGYDAAKRKEEKEEER